MYSITVYDKILESTDTQFGKISNMILAALPVLRYTKQPNLNGYMRTNIKGRVFTNDG